MSPGSVRAAVVAAVAANEGDYWLNYMGPALGIPTREYLVALNNRAASEARDANWMRFITILNDRRE